MLSAGLGLALDNLSTGPTAGTLDSPPQISNSPDSSSRLSRLLRNMYTAHLSTVHPDGSDLELNLAHSTQVSRAQLVEEELSLAPSHGSETQLEDSS